MSEMFISILVKVLQEVINLIFLNLFMALKSTSFVV